MKNIQKAFISKFCFFLAVLILFVAATVLLLEYSKNAIVNAQESITISEFSLPDENSYPRGITAGQDGNIWFTEESTNKIGRITSNGVISEFAIPTENSFPADITLGSNGTIWFTESQGNKIGRISTSGVVTEFLVPTNDSHPSGITLGPDGNIWFTEIQSNKIGRITPGGVITEFVIPSDSSSPLSIATGPDGNLWFTENSISKIGRITPAGVITEFIIPASNSNPFDIESGPDGNLWFTNCEINKIGRLTPSGSFAEFSIPTDNSTNQCFGITSGADGNLWFTEFSTNKIGRITVSGEIEEYEIPTHDSNPYNITSGVDGNIWFAEYSGNKIGRVNLSNPSTPCVIPNFGDSNGNPLRQEDNQWKNLPYGGNYYRRSDGTRLFLPFRYYGNNKDTIGAWGCKTTSAAMVVNYYAKQQNVIDPSTGNVFQTDPKKLNEWLQQNNGYYSGRALPVGNPTYWDTAFLDLNAVVRYARNNGINLSLDRTLRKNNSENIGQFVSKTKDSLNNSMCALNPAILGVNNSGHFIDSTGKLVDGGVDTWQIHDPLWNGNPPGISTLKAKYSNIYNQVDLMSGNLPKRHLTFVKYSPIEMYITDPEGKRAGLDVSTDTFYEEIPSASYGAEYLAAADGGGGLIEAGMLDVPDPIDGEYILTVVGTGNGEYGLEVRESDEEANFTANKIFGTTATNQVSTYLITPSVNPDEPALIQDKVDIRVIPDRVNPSSGVVGVVLMGRPDFNVKDVNIPSVELGEGGAKPILNRGFAVDINNDSKKDLLLFFRANQTGIGEDDSKLCLTGSKKNGLLFKGCDEIIVTQQLQTILTLILNILSGVEPQELVKIRQFLVGIK